ncbi:hypothetical protein AVEN_122515-1 [Araneus ventricosus]|uniref:Uncharacterized protein n=1 Tax=Araneus ventricosus TaxID=182803 RepID=A0A4Y2KB91_ARAVE|nr:hypothetical protein AVEN_122515-1 [Araneus ventricosus]
MPAQRWVPRKKRKTPKKGVTKKLGPISRNTFTAQMTSAEQLVPTPTTPKNKQSSTKLSHEPRGYYKNRIQLQSTKRVTTGNQTNNQHKIPITTKQSINPYNSYYGNQKHRNHSQPSKWKPANPSSGSTRSL